MRENAVLRARPYVVAMAAVGKDCTHKGDRAGDAKGSDGSLRPGRMRSRREWRPCLRRPLVPSPFRWLGALSAFSSPPAPAPGRWRSPVSRLRLPSRRLILAPGRRGEDAQPKGWTEARNVRGEGGEGDLRELRARALVGIDGKDCRHRHRLRESGCRPGRRPAERAVAKSV